MSRPRSAFNAALPILTLLFLALIWQFLAQNDQSQVHLVPAPTEIGEAFSRTFGMLLLTHIPVTLLEAGIGLVFALIIGVGVAAALDYSLLMRRALYPLLIVSQTIPLFALAPILILLLGFGMEPKITVVVLFCAFPIAVNTLDGLAGTEPAHIMLLLSVGANRRQVWRKVRLPTALPAFFSGLRIAATYAVTGAVVGEYIAPTQGIGKVMRSAYQSFRYDEAFLAAVIAILLSLLLVALVGLIERLSIPWFYARLRTASWNEDTLD